MHCSSYFKGSIRWDTLARTGGIDLTEHQCLEPAQELVVAVNEIKEQCSLVIYSEHTGTRHPTNNVRACSVYGTASKVFQESNESHILKSDLAPSLATICLPASNQDL